MSEKKKAKEADWIAAVTHDDCLVIVGGDAKPRNGRWPASYMSLNKIELDFFYEAGPNGAGMKFARKVAAAMNAAGIKPVS